MKLTIEEVDNGVILSIDYKVEGAPKEKRVYVFNEDEVEQALFLLCEIKDFLLPNRKWKKEDVLIEIGHGRGYECTDKACPICNGEV